jgi:RHS repeat-associated protein
VTEVIDSKSYSRSYQYNQRNQKTQVTYPSQRVLPISHDNAGRLSSIGGGTGPTYLSGVTYNAAEFATGLTLGNGVQETMTYDPTTLQLTGLQAVKGSSTLANLTYSYVAQPGQLGVGASGGNTGDLLSVSGTINGQTESAAYTYDLNRRLITSTQTTNSVSAQRAFSYDRWGNRLTVMDSTSGGNQIESITLQQSGGVPTNRISTVTIGSSVSYVYDAAGSVTNDGSHTYQYDAEDRLVAVDAGATASYAYDNRNRRIRKTVGGSVTHYIWENGQEGGGVLAEHDGNTGNVLVDYILARTDFVAKVLSNGTTSYFVKDRLSGRLKLDSSGNVLGQQGHLPYGEELAESGQVEKHHFTSYESDSESGLDYAMNRAYSPGTGRFLSVDPLRTAHPRVQNAYAYSANNPVSYADPDGGQLVIMGGHIYLLDCHGIVGMNGDPEDGGQIDIMANVQSCDMDDLGSIEVGTDISPACAKAWDDFAKAVSTTNQLFNKFWDGLKKDAKRLGISDKVQDLWNRYDAKRTSMIDNPLNTQADYDALQNLGAELGNILKDAGADASTAVHIGADANKRIDALNGASKKADAAIGACGTGYPDLNQSFGLSGRDLSIDTQFLEFGLEPVLDKIIQGQQ